MKKHLFCLFPILLLLQISYAQKDSDLNYVKETVTVIINEDGDTLKQVADITAGNINDAKLRLLQLRNKKAQVEAEMKDLLSPDTWTVREMKDGLVTESIVDVKSGVQEGIIGETVVSSPNAAQEEKRIAAEIETKRLAEQARLQAEMEAKREAERLETERIAAQIEAKRIEEEKRIAAEIETQRLAEQASIQAELEAKRAEEARLTAEIEAKRAIVNQKIAELEAQEKAERQAKIEANRIAANEAKRIAEEERAAVELKAKRQAEEEARRQAEMEADRIATEKARLQKESEAKRIAAFKAEQERITKELEAKREAEEERLAVIEAKKEADRMVAEAAKRTEEERIAEEQAKIEAERLAKIEADRIAANEAKRIAEEERLAEEQAKIEEERLAKIEADRIAANEAKRIAEEERIAEEQAKIEAERLAKIEADRIAANEAKRIAEEERLAAEEPSVELIVNPEITMLEEELFPPDVEMENPDNQEVDLIISEPEIVIIPPTITIEAETPEVDIPPSVVVIDPISAAMEEETPELVATPSFTELNEEAPEIAVEMEMPELEPAVEETPPEPENIVPAIILTDDVELAISDLATATPPASVPLEIKYYDGELKAMASEIDNLSRNSFLDQNRIDKINRRLRFIEGQLISFSNMETSQEASRYMNFMQVNIDALQTITEGNNANSPTSMLMEPEPEVVIEQEVEETAPVAGTFKAQHEVYFAMGGADLSAQFHQDLAALAQTARELPVLNIIIEDPAFDDTENPYRLALVQRRARAIRKYLTEEEGVSSQQILSEYFGDEKAALKQEPLVKILILRY